jgi:HlyD family secretion protein
MVSAETTQDQRTGTSYYTARVQLAAEQVAKMGDAKLLPGMPVDVFIKTPGRTALSYLIKPLRDQAERAFKER